MLTPIVIDDCRLPAWPASYRLLDDELYTSAAQAVAWWFRQELQTFLADQIKTGDEEFVFLINTSFTFGPSAQRAHRDGIALLEHIRLTVGLPDRIRWAPVVLYSFETATALQMLEGCGAIVRSPGVLVARLPDHEHFLRDLNKLASAVRSLTPVNESSLRAFLRPAESVDRDLLDPHSYRNRVGFRKLCIEFAGDVLDSRHQVLQAEAPNGDIDLKLKRLLSIMPDYAPGDPPAGSEWEEFRKSSSRYKILFVDDEHAKGWSLGLLAGVSGQDISTNQYREYLAAPLDGAHRVWAISGLDVAWKKVDECKATFEVALETWRRASDTHDDSERDHHRATRALQQALSEQQQAEKTTADANHAAAQAEKVLDQEKSAARAQMDQFSAVAETFLELSWSAADDSDQDKALGSLEGGRRTLTEISRRLEALAGAGSRLGEAQKRAANSQEALQKAAQSLVKARENAAAASRRLQDAQRALNIASGAITKAFPFRVALLDMRLKPESDRGQDDIHKLSGIRLLQHLRESLPPIPVVMLTASEKAVSYRVCIENGASAYWIKGISTGRELRDILQACYSQADLVEVWKQIEQVRVKTTLACKQWDSGQFVSTTIPKASPDRRAIDVLLADSFRKIWEQPVAFRENPERSLAYNSVIINLAGIQELRHQGVRDPNAASSVWFRTPTEDQALRKLRNEVAHPRTAPSVGRADACRYLSYTLNQLLA